MKSHMNALDYFRRLESKLVQLIRRTVPTRRLLLSIDQIENIILCVGLDLIRIGLNVHTRGIILGVADRLEHLLNMCRSAIEKDVLCECTHFADINESRITAWNDTADDKVDCLRSHMIHVEISMQIGFGVNVTQKRYWNGLNTDGMKNHKKLRVIKLNDDLPTQFKAPIFDDSKGTYDLSKVDESDTIGLDKPLLPKVGPKTKPRRVFIR